MAGVNVGLLLIHLDAIVLVLDNVNGNLFNVKLIQTDFSSLPYDTKHTLSNI